MKKSFYFFVAICCSAAMSMSMMATTHTSIDNSSVILLGDVVALTSEDVHLNFGNGTFFVGTSYTLVRGNIASGTAYYDYEGVVKAIDGAYYMFEDGDGNLYPPQYKANFVVTPSTDGLEVSGSICFDGCNYSFRLHKSPLNFADNADNIESDLATLVGQAVDISITRDLYQDGYFNTICLPFSLGEFDIMFSSLYGCEIFEFESAAMNGGSLDLYLNQVNEIEAGKPYFIRWDETPWSSTIQNLFFEGKTIETSVGQAVGSGVQLVGTIGQTQLENGNENYLFLGANNTLYWPNTDNKLKGFRAYFKVSGSVAPHGAPAHIVIRKAPTGVDNVQDAENNTQKILRDGQLIILRNGIEYNANGQAVK